MAAYDLCVVIPTLNESANIRPLMERLREALHSVRYEVVVVDDDSPDGTAAVVNRRARSQPNVRVLHRIGRRGLASACIEGILATSAPFVAVMDADLQHDENILPEMLRRIDAEGLDLVVGSRNTPGGSMGEFAAWRQKLSGAGRRLSGVARYAELTDPMSGFFIVRRQFFDRIAHRLTGIGFKILLDIVLSAEGDVRIGEVPYRFRCRQHGESKLDLIVGMEYMELLLDKLVGEYVPVRFALYSVVGAAGVLMHLLLLGAMLHWTRMAFLEAQGTAAVLVMIVNYVLNNSLTYRSRRNRGTAFWTGMLTFCLACSLGMAANLAVSGEVYRRDIPWEAAGLAGLMFSAVWNYAVTSVTTWRRSRRTAALCAERRAAAARLAAESVSSSRL